MRLRVSIVADGDPRDWSTNSGVARGLLDAFENRDEVEIHSLISTAPTRAVSLLLTLLSWRPRPTEWRNEKRKGWLATLARTSSRDRALRRYDLPPDLVVHVRNTYRPCRYPYVVFVDGTASLSQRYWADWRMTRRSYHRRVAEEKRYFENALLVATAGAHAAQEIVDFYGQSSDRVFPVGGGVNLGSAPHKPFPQTGAQRRGVRFLFVGKEFVRKGGPELLAAFAIVRSEWPDASLTIVGPAGDGCQRPGVEWRGYVSDREQLAAIYAAADVFCLPSRYEPYGLVAQEALAHGLACIVSDRGALPDIVGEAGVVVEGENVDSLAGAMLALAASPELRVSLASAAASRLSDATWDRVAARLTEAIRGRWDSEQHDRGTDTGDVSPK